MIDIILACHLQMLISRRVNRSITTPQRLALASSSPYSLKSNIKRREQKYIPNVPGNCSPQTWRSPHPSHGSATTPKLRRINRAVTTGSLARSPWWRRRTDTVFFDHFDDIVDRFNRIRFRRPAHPSCLLHHDSFPLPPRWTPGFGDLDGLTVTSPSSRTPRTAANNLLLDDFSTRPHQAAHAQAGVEKPEHK